MVENEDFLGSFNFPTLSNFQITLSLRKILSVGFLTLRIFCDFKFSEKAKYWKKSKFHFLPTNNEILCQNMINYQILTEKDDGKKDEFSIFSQK